MVAVAAVCGLVAAPQVGGARPALPAGVPDAPPADTVPDPERVLDEAKDRQRDFERHRRRRLPYDGGRAAGRCDEVVGRYCLWHDDGRDGDAEPPDEPESVERERARLLEHLADAMETVPGSRWLVGQRVRYLLEAGWSAEALGTAERCGAAEWWCRALEGRVLHARGRFVEAGEAFGAARRAMDGDRRREWGDLSVLLEGDASGRWEELGPEGRRRLVRRLWRLADPLHLVPGNDRRTEHLSRLVEVRLRRDAATPFGRFWTDGLGELTMRYGVPLDYRREPPSPTRIDPRPSVIGRHPPDALGFLPTSGALLRPGRIGEDAWRLGARRPHATYAPPYADTVRRLPHRIAVFPRGDTSVVVAAFRSAPVEEDGDAAGASPPGPAEVDGAPAEGRADPIRPGERVEGMARREALLRLVPVAALDSPSLEDAAAEDRREGDVRGGLAVRVPSRPHLLSLEFLRRRAAVADRSRYAVRLSRRPEGVPGLSDLLLLEPDAPPEGPLEEVLPAVRGPSPVRPGARLGVYWELYGPRLLLDDVEVSVALAEEDGGLVERVADALGFGEGEGVALEWRGAATRPGRVHPRGIRLRLPDDLPDGEYRVRVSVRLPGYDPLTAVHPVEVRRAGAD